MTDVQHNYLRIQVRKLSDVFFPNRRVMLQTAFNLVNSDFNRTCVAVWHVLDDVTGQPLPICGDDRLELTLCEGIVTVEGLAQGSHLPEGDEACGRCLRALTAPGTDEEKSQRRLLRARRKKKAQRLEAELRPLVIQNYLNRCPICNSPLSQSEPGFTHYVGKCENNACGREWSFNIEIKGSGKFEIWGYSAREEDPLYEQAGSVALSGTRATGET